MTRAASMRPLFLSAANGRFMTRRLVYHVLGKIAQQTNVSRDTAKAIAMHPHRLRRTFWRRDA